MNDASLSPVAKRVLALCFAVAMTDGFDTLVVSFLAPALAQEWALSAPEIGRLFGAGLLGAMLGGFAIGPVADRYGRKTMLLICVAAFALLTIACAFARTPEQLLVLRLAAGLGLGGAIPNITALTAEHAPPQRRSSLVTLMFIGFPIGAVIGGAVSSWLVGTHGWRAVFLFGGIIPMLLLPAIVYGVPETLRRGAAAESASTARTPVVAQFQEGRLPAVLLLWTGVFLIMLVSYFLVSWTPMILSLAGFSPQRAALGAVILNLGGVAGAFLLARAVDRFGPFRAVAGMLGIGALLIALLGVQLDMPQLLLPGIFITGFCVLGGQLNIPAMAARLFPLRVRGTGVGWTMGMGRIGSIVGPTIGGVVIGAGMSWDAIFLLAATPALMAAAAIGIAHYQLPDSRPREPAAMESEAAR